MARVTARLLRPGHRRASVTNLTLEVNLKLPVRHCQARAVTVTVTVTLRRLDRARGLAGPDRDSPDTVTGVTCRPPAGCLVAIYLTLHHDSGSESG